MFNSLKKLMVAGLVAVSMAGNLSAIPSWQDVNGFFAKGLTDCHGPLSAKLSHYSAAAIFGGSSAAILALVAAGGTLGKVLVEYKKAKKADAALTFKQFIKNNPMIKKGAIAGTVTASGLALVAIAAAIMGGVAKYKQT